MDSREDFFGCKLSKDSKEYVWSFADESELAIEHKLQINQACLGVEAKQGERNVVDVTTEDEDGEDITHTVLSLQLGHTDMARLKLAFLNKTTFKLVKGNGPVHLTGVHMQAAYPGSDSDEDLESDEDAPELVDSCCKEETCAPPAAEEKPASTKVDEVKVEPKAATKKPEKKSTEVKKAVDVKQAAEAKKSTEAKKPAEAKKSAAKEESSEDESEDDDDEEEDEDDDDEEEEAKVGSKVKSGKDLIMDEASEDDEEMDSEDEDDDDLDDEDDDDEDEDDDEDDDMSDDEDDSEEEEDSEEEDETSPPKAKKSKLNVTVNGNSAKKTKETGKKAAQDTKGKTPDKKKTPESKTQTPKSNKKGEIKTPQSAKAAPDIDEIRKKLLKSPNLTKTAEKFKNFMKSAHRVTEEKDVKGLWDWVQKSRK